jgi:hypothetical protein
LKYPGKYLPFEKIPIVAGDLSPAIKALKIILGSIDERHALTANIDPLDSLITAFIAHGPDS